MVYYAPGLALGFALLFFGRNIQTKTQIQPGPVVNPGPYELRDPLTLRVDLGMQRFRQLAERIQRDSQLLSRHFMRPRANDSAIQKDHRRDPALIAVNQFVMAIVNHVRFFGVSQQKHVEIREQPENGIF